MLKKTVVLFVMALSWAGIAQAQDNLPRADVTTEAMVAMCRNRSDVEAQAFCFGFGEGVYQSYVVNRPPHATNRICVSKDPVSRRQVLEDFLKWTDANPHHDQDSAAATLLRFLYVQFSCKR
ncbi:MAG: hypothetical protein IT507_10170 [Burkholderiaceae bacterium]|jgi:hypothetical protein|nr:hypothetical protein [Burkholderiaceae bacterium]